MNQGDVLAELRTRRLARPSVIALVLSNLVPLFGVLALGWDVFPVMALYWMEDIVVGFYNVLRMACCADRKFGGVGFKVFMILFFGVTYGAFCFAHGVFVFFMSWIRPYWEELDPAGPTLADALRCVSDANLGWALLALLISHSVSFVTNYLRGGEFRRTTLPALMFQPYPRLGVFQFAVCIGGFGLIFFGAPAFAVVVLIMLKIGADMGAHLREHKGVMK